MAVFNTYACLFFVSILLKATCYEKTLRKIVRSQSKMVQRPLNYMNEDALHHRSYRNTPLDKSNIQLMFSGDNQKNSKVHKYKRAKVSSVLSSIDMMSGKSLNHKDLTNKNSNKLMHELRPARNTLVNVTKLVKSVTSTENVLFRSSCSDGRHNCSKSTSDEITVDTYYEIPQRNLKQSIMSKSIDSVVVSNTSASHKVGKEVVIVPRDIHSLSNASAVHKGIFISNAELNAKQSNSEVLDVSADIENNDRVDFLIQGKPIDASPMYSYNVSVKMFSCTAIIKPKTDIDAQEKFVHLNIEPNWASRKHYWNNIYDSRYETYMRSAKWPPLKVILVPRTQVHSIWKRTFERCHNESVHKILSNVVKKLQFYSNLTFSWNEVSHLSQWWKTTSHKNRLAFRRLLKSGRLEITTGGFVESDEATAHIFGLVHQLIQGHQWLKSQLNYVPSVAWLTNSVSHSPTMPYLLSTCGISKMVITNVHFSWEEFFAEYQNSDFFWVQNWESDIFAASELNTFLGKIGNERLPKHSMLTHFLQFNSDSFDACGPNKTICGKYDFSKMNAFTHDIKQMSEMLLEQYSKSGTLSLHNVVMMPIGGSYHYTTQSEFDYQYNNYQNIMEYLNSHRNIYKASVQFGTANDYFKKIGKHSSYLTFTGDFLNFADLRSGEPAYWAGYFTSRPWFKILLRRLQYTLRSTEILLSFAVNYNVFRGFNPSNLYEHMITARDQFARLQDRHVVGGTLPSTTMKFLFKQMLATVKNCWYVQEITASLLSVKPGNNIQEPYLHKYVYRDGEFISLFRIVTPGDQLYIFNSLSHERTEIVELIVRNPNVRIIDHNKKDVTIQINPVWKYHSDEIVKFSRLFYKIVFAIVIPPLTLELYRLKETYDSSQSAATIYCHSCMMDDAPSDSRTSFFTIMPVQSGDIQLESYKHRLVFDEHTGFLKQVVEKASGKEKILVIDYGAFRSSDINSGMFLFNTNVSKPLRDVLVQFRIGMKSKVLLIISGQVTTELTTIYGRLLQSTVKIFNLLNSPLSQAISIESKVDYESSPKNREVELFLSIQTNIANGNPPKLYTDNNGFEYTARTLNLSRRIESNMYVMTTMSFIQDQGSRATVITDHAQGVTALQEGQLIVMLDRRVLFNDGRGTNEGLADSSITCHKHLILLENFVQNLAHPMPLGTREKIELPSLIATHLANSIDFGLDIFRIDRNKSHLCYYTFLPLVKTSFPCDVSLINFRINLLRGFLPLLTPIDSAMMILHRQSVTCHIAYEVQPVAQIHCNGDKNFYLDKVMHNIKSVYKTNLCGTDDGHLVKNLNHAVFPPMEIASLRISF